MAMNSKLIAIVSAAAVLAASDIALAQTQVPNVFEAGQAARASEVNENFDTLEAAIDENAADIDQNATNIDLNATAIQAIQGSAVLSPEAAQIQTALDLTSGLRWLVAEFYAENGIFPTDNNHAGADAGDSWSNRFVENANINLGVIDIQFRADAAAQIAGQQIILTPVDPGSGAVWFDCSGDGITDAYLAELDCAFSDAPLQPMHSFRQMVLTAFDMLEQSGAQQLITDYYNLNGVFPSDNQQAGLQHPSLYYSKYISDLTVSDFGQITMTFGNDAAAVLLRTTIRWSPDDSAAVINWACDSLDLPNKYLPKECRT